MNNPAIKILLVEDDQNLGYLLQRYIELHDYRVVWVKNAAGALEVLKENTMDVYISRLRKYLKKDPDISITNVHGKGFILDW